MTTVVGAALDDQARSRAAGRLVQTTPQGSSLDRLCELAAALLDTASAHVSLVSDIEVVIGEFGPNARVAHDHPAHDSLCASTVRHGDALPIADARRDARSRDLSPVTSGIIGSYLGVPLVSSEGHAVGALSVHGPERRKWSRRDITTLERLAVAATAELELAALSSDFAAGQLTWRLAADAAGVGAFDWDLVTGAMRWDDQLLELFGLDRESFGGSIEAFNVMVHPEDLPRVTAALEKAITSCGEYAAEYRIHLPDGTLRWIGARGRAIAGAEGTAVRLLGAAYDTTAVQEGEARVARVLESMPTAFFQLDREWRFTFLNSEAERMLGADRGELSGKVVWEAYPAAVGSDFERNYRGAVETGQPVSFDAYYPAPLDAWYEVRAWPNPDGLAVYFVDVTSRYEAQQQRERTTRRGALVAHVTERLTGTLDVEEAVGRLGSLVVPDLGDWCVATLVDHVGRAGRLPGLRDVGGWHRDPEQQDWVDRYAAIRLAHLTDLSVLSAVLKSDRPLVGDDATESLAQIFESGEVSDLVGRLAPQHVAVVALRGHDRVVGLLTVFRSAERGRFLDDDIDTLAEVAGRAGLALDNARLFAEQRDLAEGLQRSMLTAPPQPDHLEIAVRYEAAAETAQVGGDWYDAFVQAEGNTVLVIGDVVGHDTAAAAAMGQVRSLLRGVAVFSGEGPGDVLRGVDRALETLQVETTATAVVARLEQTPGELERGVTRLRWSNAGHPPPVVLGADDTVHILEEGEPDLLLGLDAGVDRTEHEVVLERGGTVILFTDGLVERRGEDLDVGLERLCGELGRLAAEGLCLDDLCDRLLARMAPGPREDDIALVAVRLHHQDEPRPPEAPAASVPASVDPDAPGANGRLVSAHFRTEPASIPEVRAFVRDVVATRLSSLVEDVALCVTELATNATLHGEGHSMEVSVLLEPDAVTIAVTDDGAVTLDAVVPRSTPIGEGPDDVGDRPG